ncbi:MAG: hypothetical protein IPK76_03795 [Lewinellaceae bacterium]|nr:hypothetical protein [Lewinellaceae bacterium]
MQDLKELVLLLLQHNIHPLKHLVGSGDSKMLALYEGISNGSFNSDVEAAEAIYGSIGGSSSYRSFKSDLRERLLGSVFDINTNLDHYSDYQKAYYECHKQWVMVRFLTGQNANTIALSIANKLLRQSEKLDFTLLCMDIASYLRIQYGLRESNDKRYKEVNQKFQYYRDVYDAENLAEELYTSLIVHTVNNRTPQKKIVAFADEAYQRIAPVLERFYTYKLHMYGHMIGLMRYTLVNDHKRALNYCDTAIRIFKNRPYEARVPLQIFYYQHLICNIHLRRFEDGKESARQCINLMQEGTFNWFKYMELYLYLLLHTHQYGEVPDVLAEALNHPRFEFLPDNAKEIWRIYESYVYYLGAAGQIKPTKQIFKLAKFINETPIASKDKSGLNIAIITIKLLILIQNRRFSQLLDEVEATKQYCYRHLRGNSTKRSYYFIKMLLQIPLGQFDRKLIEPKAESYLLKLKSIPLQVANQTSEIEIIPYEDLWELALASLEGPAQAKNLSTRETSTTASLTI